MALDLFLRVFCAYPAMTLIRRGASITFKSGQCLIDVSGLSFALPEREFVNGLWLLHELFVEGEYSDLQVRDAVVIDIGANLGDTAVYFASRGAHRVIAYEPFPATFALAKQTVGRNDCADRVRLVCAGAASRSGSATAAVDSRTQSGRWSVVAGNSTDRSSGNDRYLRREQIQFVSLADILQDAVTAAAGRPIACKIDCEGAEFELLLGAPLPPAFEYVTQLVIETHDQPPDPIAALLRERGYQVEVRRNGGGSLRLTHLINAYRPRES